MRSLQCQQTQDKQTASLFQHPPRDADAQQVGTDAPDTILISFQQTIPHLNGFGACGRTGDPSQRAVHWQESCCRQQVTKPAGCRACGTVQAAPPAQLQSGRYHTALSVALLCREALDSRHQLKAEQLGSECIPVLLASHACQFS